MKRKISATEKKYENEIALARANGYKGVIIPLEGDYDLHHIEDAKDKEYIYNIAYEYGWDKFIVVIFKNTTNVVKLVNLTLLNDAA
ncbi:MAG: hypothetical protein L0Y61_06370 [Epsilonproteobacteria bacterium]|nr:hypothetical protein [Campylobacterota bacterium]